MGRVATDTYSIITQKGVRAGAQVRQLHLITHNASQNTITLRTKLQRP